MEAPKFSRLPTDVVPVNYTLTLTPDLEKFTFAGSMKVLVTVNSETSTVVMNCAEIEIQSVKYVDTAENMEPSEIKLQAETETLALTFPKPLEQGAGYLHIEFTGVLNDKMKGFYRSKQTMGGVDKYFAVTQFEPTDARRCFPCWDEPAIKATFSCALVVPKHYVALSNMSICKECEDPTDSSRKICTYEKTPVMSTYLLAFVVGEYDFVEKTSAGGVKIRIYTPVGKSHQGKFALDVSVKCLDLFTQYFNIPYPMDKLDLIAIADFAAGAMENWGLITYRETALLIDPETSAKANYQRVTIVVCHELAHQWFGNLVTMEWWTHLWLNEGFASFMQYLATDFCEPTMEIWTQSLNDSVIRAMNLDALENSHPIEVPVENPDQIDEIFDAISYCKGSSVIRMLNNWLGSDNFKKGLHNYLVKFSYKNAFTEDLWRALGDASGKPVERVMSTWTKQMGFPVLDVSVKSSSEDSVTLHVTQKKFSTGSTYQGDAMWSIPITISTSQNEAHQTYLMDTRSADITVTNVSPDGWIKLNPGFIGFYRVKYSQELLDRLLPAVKSQQLCASDRLNIVNDLFAMASAGEVDIVDYLKALESYKNETEYPVWRDISDKFSEIKNMMSGDEEATKMFKKFTENLLTPTFERLGWVEDENETHLTTALRTLSLSYLNGDDIKEKCTQMAMEHVKGNKKLPVDLEDVVFQKYVAQVGKDALENLFTLHKNSESQQEQTRIMKGFAGFNDPSTFDMIVEYCMSENVRDNIRPFALSFLASSGNYARHKTWEYVKDNYSTFMEKYGGNSLLSRLIGLMCFAFVGENMKEDVKSFFEANAAPGAERTIQQALEKINARTRWWDSQRKSIRAWLEEK